MKKTNIKITDSSVAIELLAKSFSVHDLKALALIKGVTTVATPTKLNLAAALIESGKVKLSADVFVVDKHVPDPKPSVEGFKKAQDRIVQEDWKKSIVVDETSRREVGPNIQSLPKDYPVFTKETTLHTDPDTGKPVVYLGDPRPPAMRPPIAPRSGDVITVGNKHIAVTGVEPGPGPFDAVITGELIEDAQ